MDGILNIDKPAGITSYGVVAAVKRLSGVRRVGHAGTLDPDATGVLPVCLGKATRLTEFLAGSRKTYRAVVELGVTTDTYDAAGQITGTSDPSGIDRETLEQALEAFRGRISQTPPMYSAVKHRGRPLYRLARQGITVERRSRTVEVHRLELLDWRSPELAVEVECGKGTYIRSLAHDLGQALGCGAFLKSLVRTRYGPFDMQGAVPLPRLEEAFRAGDWERYVHPPDSVLQDLDIVVVDGEGEQAIRNGGPVPGQETEGEGEGRGGYRRAYSEDGRLLAVLRREPGSALWRPRKVLV